MYYDPEDATPSKHKDMYRLYGLRIVAFSLGMGFKVSFAMIVLQISSAIALLGVAQTVADFFLEHVVPERRHYIQQKIEQTESFNKE